MAADAPSGTPLTPRPASGRVFEARPRPVRFADADPEGRLRLDGIARYLQDLSADDTVDAALPDGGWWIVRRTVVEVHAFPRYLEELRLATWCSGVGSHYAERRAQLVGEHGGRVEAASLWVHVERRTGRPARVPAGFLECYGEAAAERRVTARLEHGDPPEDLELHPWAVRATDFDRWRHVNNSHYWAMVEEALAGDPLVSAPLRATVEHRTAIERGDAVSWAARRDDAGLALWVVARDAVVATAEVAPL